MSEAIDPVKKIKNSKKKEDCLDHSIDKSDYVITMKIRSDLVLEYVADMVKEMFQNSKLYRYVRYDRPHLTVRNIDTDRETSMGFFNEEPEVIPKKFKPYKPAWSTKQEDIDYDTVVIGDKVLPKPLREPEEKPHYVICSKSKFYISNEDKEKSDSVYYKGSVSECINFIVNHQDFEPIAVAFQNGKTIQAYENGRWCDYNIKSSIIPGFFDSLKWRIKPEESTEDKYYTNQEAKDRHLTNKELAMWLAQGKGLAMDKGTGRKSTSYDYWEEDKMVDYMNIAVRKWNDTKWNYPTYGYCFGDE